MHFLKVSSIIPVLSDIISMVVRICSERAIVGSKAGQFSSPSLIRHCHRVSCVDRFRYLSMFIDCILGLELMFALLYAHSRPSVRDSCN